MSVIGWRRGYDGKTLRSDELCISYTQRKYIIKIHGGDCVKREYILERNSVNYTIFRGGDEDAWGVMEFNAWDSHLRKRDHLQPS